MTDKVDDRGDDTQEEDLQALLDSTKEGDAAAEAAKALEATKAAEEAAAKDKDKSIPKARFDEAVAKERTAREKTEKELAEVRAKLKAQDEDLDAEKTEGEIAALESQVDQALADGDKAKVADLRKQIRGKMQAVATAVATRQAAYATSVAVERVRYDAAVTALEAAHPQMNPDSDQFDEELTSELIELKGAYEATGMGSSDALKKAARYVFKVAPAEAAAEPAAGETPEQKAARAKEVADKVAKAKEEAIRKAAEVRGKQPPKESGKVAANEPGAANVARMSDKEFEKLPPEEKARLRGDML